ncbi:MAG: hypothetical protein IJG48_08425 [Mogibacterium sp.]|jgi:hypothetical protein|nr:hypothetical protein [Mogibacterium sp.]
MKLDPNNDVYPGDLGILNARKHKWAKGTNKGFGFKIASYVILAAGLVAIIKVALMTQGAESSQLPVHLTIWTVAALTFIAARRGKRMSQDPFNGFHNARFEVSDDTVYYVYQQGMKLKTYFIRDAQIKKIIRDDEAGVLCIEGKATLNTQTRDSETEESLDKFYALVPFDKYELDDLLAPYKKKVVKSDGKLRESFN